MAVASTRTPPGELTTLSHTPSRTLDGSLLWRSHPTIRAFGARPTLRCPNYDRLIYELFTFIIIIIMFYYAIMAARTIQLNTDINTHNCIH